MVGVSCLVFVVQAEAQPVPRPARAWEWQREEVERYFAGAREIMLNGWGRLNAKVNRVALKLAQHTNMTFPIVPAQTGSVGQAHAGGWIILDLSTATRRDEELAFWLAHEWGHEYLGHQPNYVHPNGRWRRITTPTADEDAADEFAGDFLCKAGYEVRPVLAMLRRLPDGGDTDTHSTGTERARIVQDAYHAAGCGPDETDHGLRPPPDSTSKPACRTVRTTCIHPEHPAGDVGPCVHAAHAADAVPCQHLCAGPLGYGPCHPFDSIPCSHPAHPAGDMSPCTHLEHPLGDEREVCN